MCFGQMGTFDKHFRCVWSGSAAPEPELTFFYFFFIFPIITVSEVLTESVQIFQLLLCFIEETLKINNLFILE